MPLHYWLQFEVHIAALHRHSPCDALLLFNSHMLQTKHTRATSLRLTDMPAVACIALGSHLNACNALLAFNGHAYA